MYNFLKRFASNAWVASNNNLVAILIGGLITHQFTKSYRDQEIKDLSEDLKNLQGDLKSREDDVNKLYLSSNELRNQYLIQLNELSRVRFDYSKAQEDLKEYKWAYNNTSWCFFRSAPKISFPIIDHKNDSAPVAKP